MNDENDSIQTEATVDYYFGICVDRLRQETTNIVSQDTQRSGGESNRATPEYKVMCVTPSVNLVFTPFTHITHRAKHLKVTQPSHLASCAKIHTQRVFFFFCANTRNYSAHFSYLKVHQLNSCNTT